MQLTLTNGTVVEGTPAELREAYPSFFEAVTIEITGPSAVADAVMRDMAEDLKPFLHDAPTLDYYKNHVYFRNGINQPFESMYHDYYSASAGLSDFVHSDGLRYAKDFAENQVYKRALENFHVVTVDHRQLIDNIMLKFFGDDLSEKKLSRPKWPKHSGPQFLMVAALLGLHTKGSDVPSPDGALIEDPETGEMKPKMVHEITLSMSGLRPWFVNKTTAGQFVRNGLPVLYDKRGRLNLIDSEKKGFTILKELFPDGPYPRKKS